MKSDPCPYGIHNLVPKVKNKLTNIKYMILKYNSRKKKNRT